MGSAHPMEEDEYIVCFLRAWCCLWSAIQQKLLQSSPGLPIIESEHDDDDFEGSEALAQPHSISYVV